MRVLLAGAPDLATNSDDLTILYIMKEKNAFYATRQKILKENITFYRIISIELLSRLS